MCEWGRQQDNLPESAKGSPGDVLRAHSRASSSCCVWKGCCKAKCLLDWLRSQSESGDKWEKRETKKSVQQRRDELSFIRRKWGKLVFEFCQEVLWLTLFHSPILCIKIVFIAHRKKCTTKQWKDGLTYPWQGYRQLSGSSPAWKVPTRAQLCLCSSGCRMVTCKQIL